MAAVAGVGALAKSTSGSKHTITGTFTLHDPEPYGYSSYRSWTTGESCSGTGGYSDIDEGADVNVKNQNDTIIATGTLGAGTATSGTLCQFPISIGDVPDASFYKIEVTHRGEITYSKADMESNGWKVQPTLGLD